MDKKKLIGTIIGVVMFAALIAGATFAFLSFTATVTTATFNGTALNFIVDYAQGNAISDIPQLRSSTNASPNVPVLSMVTPSQTAKLKVTAKHSVNSAKGYVTIKLTSTVSNYLVKQGLINWVICRDPNVSNEVDDVCGTSFPTGTLTNGAAMNSGTIVYSGTSSTITLMSDAALASGSTSKTTTTNPASPVHPLESTNVTNDNYLLQYKGTTHTEYDYYIYFWINSVQITNAHINNEYKGYVHASATQLIE